MSSPNVRRAPRHERRSIDGILLLDKPAGMTSNRALQRAKALYRAAKAGHTGSLDPLATGLLPICFGAGTRLAEFLLASRKAYRVKCLLGVATDTADADGQVTSRMAVPPLTQHEVAACLASFIGDSVQVPPKYSALKHGGRRLYELARAGADVPRAARTITIYAIGSIVLDLPRLSFVVQCSKGTYVRSLVEDLARALGTVGHVTMLRRLSAGPFDVSRAHELGELEALEAQSIDALDGRLLSIDSALPDWPRVELDPSVARRLCQGQSLEGMAEAPTGFVKVYAGPASARSLVGLGEILEGGRLRPYRIFAAAAINASEPSGVEVEYPAGLNT